MSTVKDDCELIILGIFVTWTMRKVRDAHRNYLCASQVYRDLQAYSGYLRPALHTVGAREI